MTSISEDFMFGITPNAHSALQPKALIRLSSNPIEVPFANFQKRVAAGEAIEPSSSSSKPDVLPITPTRKQTSPKFQVQGPKSVGLS